MLINNFKLKRTEIFRNPTLLRDLCSKRYLRLHIYSLESSIISKKDTENVRYNKSYNLVHKAILSRIW
jgi:hypothetical protein